MSYRNLTLKPVTIVTDLEEIYIPPSGQVPRAYMEAKPVGYVGVISIFEAVSGVLVELPEAKEGVWLIVDRSVAMSAPERGDLLVPGALAHVVRCGSFESWATPAARRKVGLDG